MKNERQIKRKRYALLGELKDIRKIIYSKDIPLQNDDIEYLNAKEKDRELMSQINAINWILK